MKAILSFKYNNRKYYIVDDNNKYKSCYLDQEKLKFNLSEDEKDLIEYIIDNLVLSGSYLSVTPLVVDNVTYPVYFDNYKKLYFTNTQDEKIVSFINRILNNQNPYLSVGGKKESFKRRIKIGKKILVVYILASTSLLGCANIKEDVLEQFQNNDSYEVSVDEADLRIEDSEVEEIVITDSVLQVDTEDDEKESKINEFIEAVNNNSNLTDSEKEVILDNIFILEDNYDYIDVDLVINRFATLQIEYNNESNYAVGGEYYSGSVNKIVIYSASSYEDIKDTYKKYIFSHEISHVFTNIDDYVYTYSEFLTETTNSVFNDEYFSDTTNVSSYDLGYLELEQLTKALIEVIGEEPFRKYQFSADTTYIKDALMEIMNSEIDADLLIANLDQYFNYNIALANGTYEDISVVYQNKEAVKNASIDFIKQYYSIKYDASVEDDLVMLRYLDYDTFKEKIKEIYNLSDAEVMGMMIEKDKYYFNSNETLSDNIVISVPVVECVNSVEVDINEYLNAGYNIDDSFYEVDGKWYKYGYSYTGEYKYIEISNENRYITNELGR